MNCALSGTFVTEAELPKGMATADGDCALGCRSASALQLDALPLSWVLGLGSWGRRGDWVLGLEVSQRAGSWVLGLGAAGGRTLE